MESRMPVNAAFHVPDAVCAAEAAADKQACTDLSRHKIPEHADCCACPASRVNGADIAPASAKESATCIGLGRRAGVAPYSGSSVDLLQGPDRHLIPGGARVAAIALWCPDNSEQSPHGVDFNRLVVKSPGGQGLSPGLDRADCPAGHVIIRVPAGAGSPAAAWGVSAVWDYPKNKCSKEQRS
jgi:hypothetical protein